MPTSPIRKVAATRLPKMRRPLARTVEVFAILLSAGALLIAVSAQTGLAAGDPSLDRLIVGSPGPGWQPLPKDGLQKIASAEQDTLSGLGGGTVSAAAGGSKRGGGPLPATHHPRP